jgi:hypothetical protein
LISIREKFSNFHRLYLDQDGIVIQKVDSTVPTGY